MYLNSRDLLKRLGELEGEYEDFKDELENSSLSDEEMNELNKDILDWENAYLDEMKELQNLMDQLENHVEFSYGITLIPENEFEDYVQNYAEDIGAFDNNNHWIVVDWEATADNLRSDFNEVEYENETYLYRAY